MWREARKKERSRGEGKKVKKGERRKKKGGDPCLAFRFSTYFCFLPRL